MTQLYGPAVRRNFGDGEVGCTNESGLFVEPRLRAMMDIRAPPISLADRPEAATDYGCAGETVPHLLFLSQTSAGLCKLIVSDMAPHASSGCIRGS